MVTAWAAVVIMPGCCDRPRRDTRARTPLRVSLEEHRVAAGVAHDRNAWERSPKVEVALGRLPGDASEITDGPSIGQADGTAGHTLPVFLDRFGSAPPEFSVPLVLGHGRIIPVPCHRGVVLDERGRPRSLLHRVAAAPAPAFACSSARERGSSDACGRTAATTRRGSGRIRVHCAARDIGVGP